MPVYKLEFENNLAEKDLSCPRFMQKENGQLINGDALDVGTV